MLLDGWRWPQPCDAKIGCAEWDCCIDAIDVARERRERRRLELDHADAGRVVKLQCGAVQGQERKRREEGQHHGVFLARAVETHDAPARARASARSIDQAIGNLGGRATSQAVIGKNTARCVCIHEA